VTRAVWIEGGPMPGRSSAGGRGGSIEGGKFELAPAALLGQGGEAEVYDLGDGRVLKWWKPEDHPDFAGDAAAQAVAARRIAEAPARLAALPGALPAAVVAPCGLARASKRGGAIVGYLMPRVGGTALHAYGEPRWRRDHVVEGAQVVAALLALHDALAGLHRASVVMGDCNDLNVLVEQPGARVHLIDVDSYQHGAYACAMFSERFVDPRLCGAASGALVPQRPHDRDSDWFAFAAMAFRSLLGVGPWGGVHAALRTPAARALARTSVLAGGIVYPRAARPLATLPDDVLAAFRDIFERDVRGEFPRALLERLRLRRCTQCGDEHARARCPTCQALALLPPVVVAPGGLRHAQIALGEVALGTWEVTRDTRPVWLDGGALLRSSGVGSRLASAASGERIGSVLAQQTRAWCGAWLGIGFYRAGGYAVGFVFRPDRGVLDDRVKLPKLRGQLVSAHATCADDRAWLALTTAEAGVLVTTLIVIDAHAHAHVLAVEQLPSGSDVPWLAGLPGAVAAGAHLFVPTDAGIARLEVNGVHIAQTRVFAETAALVSAGDRLALHASGIDVIRRRDAVRLHLA
jgi:hypothetical protein